MVYIQQNPRLGIAHHFDAACAMYGAIETGEDFNMVSYEILPLGAHDARIKRNLFVGSVEFMNMVFKRAGLAAQPRVPVNSNRKSKVMSLIDAKLIAQSENIFVKPVDIKLFTGLVLDGFQYACLDKVPDDTMVLVYEPFSSRICSEWRVYVHNHEAVFVSNYAGDIFDPPSPSYIRHIIDGNKGNFPIAYTIDIAVLQNGDFVVVEYNDMWAIGNYGVPNDMYLKMLKDRYFQIINNKS